MSSAPFDLVATAAHDHPSLPAFRLVSMDGTVRTVDADRWFHHPCQEEEEVLDLALSPVLDVGCGPGRHSIALARRGLLAIGVDVGPSMVALARRRGAMAILASVFDPLPGAGSWGSALLLDGNVGIGGDPGALMRRLRSLVRPGGRVLVETGPPREPARSHTVRLLGGGARSPSFRWAGVGARALAPIAQAAGFHAVCIWERKGRWFARLDAS